MPFNGEKKSVATQIFKHLSGGIKKKQQKNKVLVHPCDTALNASGGLLLSFSLLSGFVDVGQPLRSDR